MVMQEELKMQFCFTSSVFHVLAVCTATGKMFVARTLAETPKSRHPSVYTTTATALHLEP